MKKIFVLSFSLLLGLSSTAQSTFGKLFRSKATFPIVSNSKATFLQTIDSSLLLIYNVVDTTTGTNLYLQKLSYDGDVIWEKQVDLPIYYEILTDAVQMPDSNINILCTYNVIGTNYDEEVYFVKIDLDGNLLNTHFQTFSGICCWDVADGRLNLDLKSRLLTTHRSFGISSANGIVSVLDSSNSYSYIFGGNDNTALYHADMFQDVDSNYLSLGYESVSQQKRVSLVKRNKNFLFQWQKFYRHPSTATSLQAIADDVLRVDNNYVVLTHFQDSNAINNIYIIKTNLNGDSIASSLLTNEILPFGIYSLGSNGFILAGSAYNTLGYAQLELIRLDTSLQIVARQRYRYKDFKETCWSFKPADDGTFLIAASADSATNRNIHILKVLPDLCIDPSPSFSVNYNTGFGNGVAGIVFNNISDYGIWDTLNTTAIIYFGDGDSANFYTDTLSHVYPSQGTYHVTLVVSTPCGTKSYSAPVVVPCTGQPSAYNYTTNLLSLNVNYGHNASFYNWTFGDGGTANTPTATHLYSSPGIYYVCLITTNTCGNISVCDSINVVCSAPVISIPGTINSCNGNTVNLDAGNQGSSFIWSDGQSSQVALFNSAGIYTVTVTNNCGVSSTASVNIQFSAIPQIYIGKDTIMCINDLAIFTDQMQMGNYNYQWFNNYQIQATGNAYYFSSFVTGLFHVVLIADNNGCLDSVSRNVTVSPALLCDTGSYCIPVYSTGTAQGDYIKRVSLGTINNVTGGLGQPAYVDYTNLVATYNAGANVTLTLDFNEVNAMYYKVWVDYNQDGVFSTTEVLSSNAVNPGVSTIFSTLSASAYGGPTRMRVRCASYVNSNIDPCTSYAFGQTEDYTINILNGIGAPIAKFSADTTHININGVVNFFDNSYNNPTSWEWTFVGSNTLTSTVKNPSGIIYPTPGCFPVTLKAYNSKGFNFKTDTCFIDVDLTVSLHSYTNSNDFNVQPNPFSRVFSLRYKINHDADLKVYDVSGRKLLEMELIHSNSSIAIDLSKFENGIYYLDVMDSNSRLFKTVLFKMQ